MLDLSVRMDDVEVRVDRLEAIFGRFITRTEMLLHEMDRRLTRFEQQAEKDREEARKDREESRKDREESRKSREETRQEMRNLARQLGEISNRQGTLVEDLIAPSLRRMARVELDCGELEFFTVRIEKRHALTGQLREFDALYVGQQAILLNETKATARPQYVAEFVEFLSSGEFWRYFPEYTGRPIVPVFSSLYIPENVLEHLTRQRIYAVGMGKEAMEVLNLEQLAAENVA